MQLVPYLFVTHAEKDLVAGSEDLDQEGLPVEIGEVAFGFVVGLGLEFWILALRLEFLEVAFPLDAINKGKITNPPPSKPPPNPQTATAHQQLIALGRPHLKPQPPQPIDPNLQNAILKRHLPLLHARTNHQLKLRTTHPIILLYLQVNASKRIMGVEL